MIVLRAFKTELDFNNAQRTACARHAGVARFAYNWGLARKIEAYQNGEKAPTAVNSRPMCTSHSRIDVYHQNECGWG